MTCNKQNTINKIARLYMKDLKASNEASGLGMTHQEIKDKAFADAEAYVERMIQAQQDEFADEVDIRAEEEATLPAGVVSELNADSPKIGKANVKVTRVTNDKVYVRFKNGKQDYGYDHRRLSLNQKDPIAVINKYKALPNGSTLGSTPNSNRDRAGDKVLSGKDTKDFAELSKLAEKLEADDSVELTPEFRSHISKMLKYIAKVSHKSVRDMNIYLSDKYAHNDGFVSFDDKADNIFLKAGNKPAALNTNMSMPEILTHELIHTLMHAGFTNAAVNVSREKTLLVKLRAKAMNVLTPEDLVGGIALNPIEMKIAEARLKYLIEGKDSLEEFAAIALSNMHVFNKLKDLTLREKRDTGNKAADTIYNTVMSIIDKVMTWFDKGDMTLTGDKLLMKIVSDIHKANHKAGSVNKSSKLLESVDYKIDSLETRIKNWMETSEISMHKDIEEKIKDGKKLTILDQMKFAHYLFNNSNGAPIMQGLLHTFGLKEEGLIQTVLRHVKSGETYGSTWEKMILASQRIDINRESIAANTAKVLNAAFNKTKLDKANKKALYGGTILVDIGALTKVLTKDALQKVYESDTFRNEQIEALIAGIKGELSTSDFNYAMHQTRGLATMMITGKSSIVQRKNAAAIADAAVKDSAVTPELVSKIDQLVTLYAIGQLDSKLKAKVAKAIENDYEGIRMLGESQKGFNKYLIDKEPEQEFNVVKNYHRETFNSEYAVEIAAIDPKTRRKMKDDGFELVDDVANPGLGFGTKEKLGLYVNTNKPKSPMNRASLRYTGDREPGMTLVQDAFKRGMDDVVFDVVKESKLRAATIASKYEQDVRNGVEPAITTNVVPVVNERNVIVDYRTIVPMTHKLEFMGLEMDAAQAIGRSWAHEVDLEESRELNGVAWDTMMDDMIENGPAATNISNSGYRYVDITEMSNIPEIADAYKILPKDFKDKIKMMKRINKKISMLNKEDQDGVPYDTATKRLSSEERAYIEYDEADGYKLSNDFLGFMIGEDKAAKLKPAQRTKLKRIFKKNTFKVRRDMLLDIFGVRDASIANLLPDSRWTKDLKKAIKMLEAFWKEIVQIFKVDVIIRTLPVLFGNIVSNLMYSLQYGLWPTEVVRMQMKGVRELQLYLDAEAEHSGLIAQIAADPTNKKLKLRKAELEGIMEASSVAPLMKAGLYQHIIEDVNIAEFKSNNKIVRYIDKKTEGAPELLKTAGNWMFMSSKTGIFQKIQTATAYSDFVARYAQYTLGTEKEMKLFEKRTGRPMTSDEVAALKSQMITRVTDAYINYSKPDNKILQYLNDMGFVAFTKYGIRVQRGIQDLVRLKPLRFTLAVIGQELFEAGTGWNPSDVAESSFFSQSPTDWLYSPGFSKIIGDVMEPQAVQILREALG